MPSYPYHAHHSHDGARYTRFPYNVNASGGWYDETDCPSNGSISSDTKIKRHEDWKTVDSSTQWIATQVAAQKKDPANARPWFAYQGMNIVHPGYATNAYWYAKIDQSKVTVPSWAPLKDLHPCDFQSSMLKKCTPAGWFPPHARSSGQSHSLMVEC